MKRHLITITISFFLFPAIMFAQEWDPQHDTLTAAVKTDSRRVVERLGKMSTGLEGVRRVISPLGEGDPIRWAQGLPGVTTGADGTTHLTPLWSLRLYSFSPKSRVSTKLYTSPSQAVSTKEPLQSPLH